MPLAYAQDPAAQQLTVSGIEAGMDRDLTFVERVFFVLPLGHSEDLAMQEKVVRYIEQMVDLMPSHLRSLYEFGVEQARGHRDVIARFGRHPHRNARCSAAPPRRKSSST